MIFDNRRQAGEKLALIIKQKSYKEKMCVVALPRGGIETANEISSCLSIPLFILPIKKIISDENPELALGAVTFSGDLYINKKIYNVYPHLKTKELVEERIDEIAIMIEQYGFQNYLPVESKIKDFQRIIITDDGAATGASIRVAYKYFQRIMHERANNEIKIMCAIPVIAREVYNSLASIMEIIALEISDNFSAVGEFYKDFHQLKGEEVIKIISKNPYENNCRSGESR